MAVTPQTLAPLLGSVWRTVFFDDGQLAAYLAGLSAAEAEVDAALHDAVAAVNRQTTPIYDVPNWRRLLLRKSKLNAGVSAAYRYGDADLTYGSGVTYGAARTLTRYRYAVDDLPIAAPFLTTSPAVPDLVWTEGLDYTINADAGYIEFRQDPFAVAAIPLYGIYADNSGAATDEEIELWLCRPQYDRDNVYRQWGYALQFRDQNGAPYRQAVNALFDSAIEGASTLRLRQYLSAVCDVPIAQGDETVESIFTSDGYLWIATDRNVYRHHPNCTATVAVGDVLVAAQTMTDAVRIDDFGRGQLPAGVVGLSLDAAMLSADAFGGLFFVNAPRAVTLSTDADGFTDLRFDVGGWPADADWLFDTLHARGKASGTTLAMLLDQRENKVGQPTAANLPTWINPAQFVTENVLRNNALLIRVQTNLLGENALSLAKLRLLRRLLPPHTTALVELTAAGLSSTLDAAAIDDTITPVACGDTVTDALDPASLLPDTLQARYIDGVCL